MKKLPWFAWFPKDVFGSSRYALMTLPEQGAYRNLIDRSWLCDDQGYLSNVTADSLKKLSGWSEYESECADADSEPIGDFKNVLAMFETDDQGRVYSPRLIESRDERAKYIDDKVLAGRESARVRAENRRNNKNVTDHVTRPQQKVNRPRNRPRNTSVTDHVTERQLSETETETDKKEKPFVRRSAGHHWIAETFDRFWNAYAKKSAPGKCKPKWDRIVREKGTEFAETIIAAATEYTRRFKDSGKHPDYKKAPLTWLNGQCWEDDLDALYPPAAPAATPESLQDEFRSLR